MSSTLLSALDCGNVEELSTIIAHSPGLLSTPDSEGHYPLHRALQGGHCSAIEAVANFDRSKSGVLDSERKSCLHIVASDCNGIRAEDRVPLLLFFLNTCGLVDGLDAQDQARMTPLHHAAQSGFVDVIAALFEAGSEAFLTRAIYEVTPLHSAICSHQPEAVSLIIELASRAGVRTELLNSLDEDGRTPFQEALSYGDLLTLEAVFNALTPKEREDCLTRRDAHGRTPLQYALAVRKMAKVRFLQRNGAQDDSDRSSSKRSRASSEDDEQTGSPEKSSRND